MDIKLDTNLISPSYGDSLWQNGPLTKEYTTQPLTQTVAQRLRIRLLTFEGEWFLDTLHGVPYWQRILGKKITKTAIDQIFQQEILEENGVKEITQFSSTFENRKYSATFRVRVVGGDQTETITISP